MGCAHMQNGYFDILYYCYFKEMPSYAYVLWPS
jgi:hypothetical protein